MLRTLLYLLWILHLANAGNLTAGGFHSCAFSSTVGLKCWGKNDLSQLGDGTTISPRSTPVSASALSVPASSIKKVSAGETHTCVLVVDGTVRCWGANSWGQLGDGTQSSRSTPYTVPMITNATDISCSFYHTCAALRGGTVMCWGMNDFGQLGDGTVTMRLSPVFVGSMSTATAVAAGRLFSCALITGGSVKCWGYNGDGALGDGTNTNKYTPTTVSSISGVTQVAAGWGHVCALLSDTSVRCWGLNSNGQLGDSTVTSKYLPVSPSLAGVTSVGAGLYHTCAALSDTRVKCWGSNAFGQIGDGTATSRTAPVTVGSVGIEIASISLGYYHSCTLLIDFTVFCWGYNVYGQIGDGTTVTSRFSPVSITLVTPSSQPTNQPSSQPSRQPSGQPTRQPSSQPTRQPTRQPSAQPSAQPTIHPSGQPTRQPSLQPSSKPTRQPSRQPSARPTTQPTWQPSGQPSRQPSRHPTCQPSRQPTSQPSRQPTFRPSRQPTSQPSRQPSRQPSSQPSNQPTEQPTAQPSRDPTGQPSQQPTSQPSNQPTSQPSNQPTACPSRQPTDRPTTRPTTQPTLQPTGHPTVEPTAQPSSLPLSRPTSQPSTHPTTFPSLQPSSQPSASPTGQPSRQPSSTPTSQPTVPPSAQPSTQPSSTPSDQPSTLPSSSPSSQPTTQPSQFPTGHPSTSPSTQPSQSPTAQPTRQPAAQPSNDPTSQPSEQPTSQPTRKPTTQPTREPTLQPIAWPTSQPSCLPTGTPTSQPFTAPSRQPIAVPSSQPSTQPSHFPTTQPSHQPSAQPSMRPSVNPSAQPTRQPSTQPSTEPSTQPTLHPTAFPTSQPSMQPTSKPSRQPTSQPTVQPSTQPQSLPTVQPSMQPSTQPSSQPSSQPTRQPTCQPTHQPTSHPTSRSLRFPTSIPVSNIVNVLIDGALQAFNRSVGSTYTSVTDGFQLALAVVKPTSTGSHNGSVSIALPDSRTTVSVSTAISAAGQVAGPVAVVVTTVEVDANRFSSSLAGNDSTSPTTNGSSLAAFLPKPMLVSSVVTIQMSQLSQNGSLSVTAVPYFETQLAVTRSNSSASLRPAVLVHNCTMGVAEMVSMYCADTAVRLNLTCSGRAAASVRRQCPISQAVCSVVDLADNRIVSSSFCRAVDLGASVVCQCGGNGGANATALASTGRVSVGVFQAYGTGSFTASVALATSLSASDVASKSVTMFASFGCIWGLGLLLLLSLSRDMAAQRKKRLKQQQKLLPSTTHTSVLTVAELQQTTNKLLRCLLPAFFRESHPSITPSSTTTATPTSALGRRSRWWYVMLACHPYLRMGRALYRRVVRTVTVTTAQDEEKEVEENEVEETRWVMLDVIHALTALTMACFLLAVLYDFQYPNDDGSCALQTTVTTCESRKMLLDPFQSQCLWRPRASSTDDSGIAITQIIKGRVVETLPIEDTPSIEDDTGRRPCQFNGSNNSSVAFVVSYLITSLFASLLKMFLDRCMGVLMAHSTKEATDDTNVNGDSGGESRTAVAAGRMTAAVAGAVAAAPVREIELSRRDRHQRFTNEEELKAREYPVVLVERLLRSLRVATSTAFSESHVASLAMAMEGGGSTSAIEKQNDYGNRSPADDGLRQQRPSLSSMDLAVTMLRLAMADVVGQTRGAAERHVLLLGLYRAFPAVVSLRHVWAWQCLVVVVLVACNGGALYYIVGKAAVRGYHWQLSFLQIAAFEWCSEVLLLQSLEVWLFDYGLCWLVRHDVDAAIRILVRSAIAKTAVVAVDNDGGAGEGPLSLVMARQWPLLPESRWLQSLWSSLLPTTTVRVKNDDTSHHHENRRRIHRRWLLLLARGSQETWEKAVSFVATLMLAWLVYTYYRFIHRWLFALRPFYFDVAMAGLAAVPAVIVVALVCYCRSRTAADGDAEGGPAEERATSEGVEGRDVETLPLNNGYTETPPQVVVVVVETLGSSSPSLLQTASRPASRPVSRPVSREHRAATQRRHRQRRPRSVAAVVSTSSGPRHSPSKSRGVVRPASPTVVSSSSGSSDDNDDIDDDDGSREPSSSDSFESFDDVSEGNHDVPDGSGSDSDNDSGSGGSDGGRFSLNLSWSSFSHSDSDSDSTSDSGSDSNRGRNGCHRGHGNGR